MSSPELETTFQDLRIYQRRADPPTDTCALITSGCYPGTHALRYIQAALCAVGACCITCTPFSPRSVWTVQSPATHYTVPTTPLSTHYTFLAFFSWVPPCSFTLSCASYLHGLFHLHYFLYSFSNLLGLHSSAPYSHAFLLTSTILHVNYCFSLLTLHTPLIPFFLSRFPTSLHFILCI